MHSRMKVHVLFVCLMLLFMSALLKAIHESDDDSFYDPITTPEPRQRTGRFGMRRCPPILNFRNGRVKIRSRGRIARFRCNKGFQLVGSGFNTCIRSNWNNPIPACVVKEYSRTSSTTYYGNETSITPDSRTNSSEHWSIPTPQSRVANQDELNAKTPEDVVNGIVNNTAITAKSESTMDSKISTMTTMFVSSVININATSNESTSHSADESTTLMSRIKENTNKSYASTPTNIIPEVLTLTTTTNASPIAFQSKIGWTESTIQTNNSTLSGLTKTYSHQSISPKLMLHLSTDASHEPKPTLTSTPISTLASKSTQPMSTPEQKSKVLNWTETDISERVTPSESKVQGKGIIESETTAAKPITRESSTWRSDDSVTHKMIQSVTTSATAVHNTSDTIIVTTALRQHNDQNYFYNNTNRQSSSFAQTLISYSTVRPSLPINEPLIHEQTTGTTTTTIIPIIKTTLTLRRRRKIGRKTSLISSNDSSSNSSNNKLNKSFAIVVVSLVLIAIIALSVSLYFIRNRKNTKQDKLSEDSEMLYLSVNEVF